MVGIITVVESPVRQTEVDFLSVEAPVHYKPHWCFRLRTCWNAFCDVNTKMALTLIFCFILLIIAAILSLYLNPESTQKNNIYAFGVMLFLSFVILFANERVKAKARKKAKRFSYKTDALYTHPTDEHTILSSRADPVMKKALSSRPVPSLEGRPSDSQCSTSSSQPGPSGSGKPLKDKRRKDKLREDDSSQKTTATQMSADSSASKTTPPISGHPVSLEKIESVIY